MPKPFQIKPFIRNFVGSGTRFGKPNKAYDRRIDWVAKGRVEDAYSDTGPPIDIEAESGSISFGGGATVNINT